MTAAAFAAWAVDHGWTLLVQRPAVVTGRHATGCTWTWEKQPGGWWRVTERRGGRPRMMKEEAT